MPDICLIQTVLTARSDEALFVSIQRCPILLNDPWHEMQHVCCVTVYLSCIILQLVPKQRHAADGPFSPHGDRQNFLSNHDGTMCHLSTARNLLNLENIQTKTRKYYSQIRILSSKHCHGILRYFSVCFGSLNIILSFPIFVQWKLFIWHLKTDFLWFRDALGSLWLEWNKAWNCQAARVCTVSDAKESSLLFMNTFRLPLHGN